MKRGGMRQRRQSGVKTENVKIMKSKSRRENSISGMA